ncbi:MAG TPA: hypothetical protein VH761_15345 [Ilumatobacteraceae bacterium]
MSNVSDTHTTSNEAGGPVLGDLPALIRFAADATETQRLDDGIYCFDRDWASDLKRGRSLRYTLMVALGFWRAEQAGYAMPRQARDLADIVMAHEDELTPGDRGLALWLLVRLGDARAERLVDELVRVTDADLVGLEGMEIGWLVLGAAHARGAGLPGADALHEQQVQVLRSRRARQSPLYHHLGTGKGRALLPNFATQIYSLLALSESARVTNDSLDLGDARRLADLLVELRRPDGGWPWLYHAEKGTVVEAHQVYSVHQDAMAPMGYFALSEVTGDPCYAHAAAEGLPWCFGNNELGFHFYDGGRRFAHRAIKKRGWADRGELWANTAIALAGSRRRVRLGTAEVNTTCRPYHQGWIIEAWAGREHHGAALGGGS